MGPGEVSHAGLHQYTVSNSFHKKQCVVEVTKALFPHLFKKGGGGSDDVRHPISFWVLG